MNKNLLVITILFFSGIFLNKAIAQDFKKLDKSPMDMASYPSNNGKDLNDALRFIDMETSASKIILDMLFVIQ